MNVFLRQFIVFVLKALARINASQWQAVVDLIIRAEEIFVGGDVKENWVRDEMAKLLPGVARWIADLVFSSALGYANQKGWISLSK